MMACEEDAAKNSIATEPSSDDGYTVMQIPLTTTDKI
jgi:hypothetical protein